MTKSTEQSYGRYTIRTFATDGKVRARAFIGGKSAAYVEGATVDEALRNLRPALDERDAQQRKARKNGVPTSQEFSDAFARLNGSIGRHHWLMLKELLAAPGGSLTATQIAAAAGYPTHDSANMHLGKLARMIAEDLAYSPPTESDGTPIWTMTLATGAREGINEKDGHWRWTLRGEVAEALRELNVSGTALVGEPRP